MTVTVKEGISQAEFEAARLEIMARFKKGDISMDGAIMEMNRLEKLKNERDVQLHVNDKTGRIVITGGGLPGKGKYETGLYLEQWKVVKDNLEELIEFAEKNKEDSNALKVAWKEENEEKKRQKQDA